MKCPICNKKMTVKKDPYHYSESGLDNIFLMTDVYKCSCGEVIADIPNIYGLHELIAKALVKKVSMLTSKEIKFLRKKMHLKATALADILGVSKVTVSRWENGVENMGIANDKLIRFLYTQMFQEKCQEIIDFIDNVKEIRPSARSRKIIIPKKDIKGAICHF